MGTTATKQIRRDEVIDDLDLALPSSAYFALLIKLLECRDKVLPTAFIVQHRHTFAAQYGTFATIELFQCDYLIFSQSWKFNESAIQKRLHRGSAADLLLIALVIPTNKITM